MKGKSIFKALAVLAIVALGLFVSCSDNIVDESKLVDDALVYATFDKNSRDVEKSTYTQTVTIKEISDVYWTYTAEKADNAGKTGEKSAQTAVKSTFDKGLSGVIGPFSQGEWNFYVYGYKDTATSEPAGNGWVKVGENKYYTGLIYTNNSVVNTTLKTGTEDHPDPINVVINLLTEGTGTFEISNLSNFVWKDDGGDNANMYLTMLATYDDTEPKSGAFELDYDETNKAYYFKKTDNAWPALSWDNYSAGSWTMSFAVVQSNGTKPSYSNGSWTNVSYTYAESPELLIKVYVGQTTKLQADVIEGNFAYGKIDGTIDSDEVIFSSTVVATINENEDTVLTSTVTPASAVSSSTSTESETKVTIPTNTNEFTSGSTANLTVTAYPIATASNMFNISSNEKTSVGAIDLKASVTTTKTESSGTTTETRQVDAFTTGDDNKPVAVTVDTKIAAGMSKVTLTYIVSDEKTETWNSVNGTTAYAESDIKAPTENEAGICYYDSATGRLVFKTTHFSTFIVEADIYAYLLGKNTSYNTLEEAVEGANSGETIRLFKDVELRNEMTIANKTITLDMSFYGVESEKKIKLGTNGVVIVQNSASVDATNFIDAPVKIGSASDGSGRYYPTLETAVENAEEGSTITLLEDVYLSSHAKEASYELTFKKDVTLDMNKHRISSQKLGVVYQGEKFTIKNGTFSAEDSYYGDKKASYALFIGSGNGKRASSGSVDSTEKDWVCTLENVTCDGGVNVCSHQLVICNSNITGTHYYALWSQAEGKITVESGTFTSAPSDKGWSVFFTYAEIILKGGTFTANGNAVNMFRGDENKGGKITVEGGTFNYNVMCPDSLSTNLLSICGGTFSDDPKKYVANGYESVENAETNPTSWTVKEKATSN